MTYGNVKIEDGKHGKGDFRVTFKGVPFTLAELVFMVGWTLKAEDRYSGHRHLGRILLMVHLLSVMEKGRDAEQILKVARDTHASVAAKNPTSTTFFRSRTSI